MNMKMKSILLAAVTLSLVGATFVMAERSKPLTAYQLQLRSQVDNANGSPKNGRDPAGQPQTSLAWAASQAVGTGLRTDKPAAAVTEDHSHHVHSEAVLPVKGSGKLSNGCLTGYPNPGEKCVSSAQPGSQTDLDGIFHKK
jgi:hypothetical protein